MQLVVAPHDACHLCVLCFVLVVFVGVLFACVFFFVCIRVCGVSPRVAYDAWARA